MLVQKKSTMRTSGRSPFEKVAKTDSQLSEFGERALIHRLCECLAPVSPPSPQGMGDDCALIRIPDGKQQILTTDYVTFDQHFTTDIRPEQAGAKLVKRNLSDIAAMGGNPGPALLSLLCGPDTSVAWLECFVRGLCKSALHYGVTIVGGDVSQLNPGNFSAGLTLTGTVGGSFKLRNTAAVGDRIYVTGELGGSLAGKHYKFEPRLNEGRWLASRAECSAMMDLTDGLAKDLEAILPPLTSGLINTVQIPLSAAASVASKSSGRPALEHAFCDGEDYELLFCCSATSEPEAFETNWRRMFPELPIQEIGSIVAAGKARLINAPSMEPLSFAGGFEHFIPR